MHLPRSNCVSWSCIARNPPPERSNQLSGENLIHQVRELRRNPHGDALSRRLSHLWCSSVSGGTADGGKEHEGFAPSYSAAGENHLHPGKPSLPSFIKIVWCRCVASAAIQLRKTVPVGSRTSGARPLAGEPPTGGKGHEGFAPSYSAAGENHLHPGKQVCRSLFFHRYTAKSFQQLSNVRISDLKTSLPVLL